MSDEIPIFPVTFTEGDRRPEINGTLCGVDLTGHTITLHVDRPTTVLVKSATAVDLTQGQFKFEWSASDLVAGCGQLAEVQIVDTAGKPLTSKKFIINVNEQIA